MSDTIEVRDVIETNDCAGKKMFYVTSMAEDETIQSLYRLNHGWLPPHMRLALASVAPMDKVKVIHQLHIEDLRISGDFIENLSDTHHRDPVCRCGTAMVSDGFDIHCPNPNCALTLAARLGRLGTTAFFDFESITRDGELVNLVFEVADRNHYTQPFMVITEGVFWGIPGGSIETLLLNHRGISPNVATFLVPELFDDFLEDPSIRTFLSDAGIANIRRFYGWMDETINRRDTSSIPQNRLLAGFLWSLGIEALKPQFIEAIFAYETNVAFNDPAVLYAFLLTSQFDLVHELGLHPLEAAAIVTEVRRRKFEISDVLTCYALNKDDVAASFAKLM